MLRRFNIDGCSVVASTRSEAFNRAVVMRDRPEMVEVRAESIDFGEDEDEIDLCTKVTFVVPEDADVKPLLKVLNKKGCLLVNFAEGAEPTLKTVLEPKDRKLTEKKSGGYKMVKITDASEATLKNLEGVLNEIADAQASNGSLRLVLVGFDGSVEEATLDYSVSSVGAQ